jgi:hypothetical protein
VAVDPSQNHLNITLAEKTIKKFRLASNAILRMTLSYVPVTTFGSTFDMFIQTGADTTPSDPNTNGNNVAHVQVTVV